MRWDFEGEEETRIWMECPFPGWNKKHNRVPLSPSERAALIALPFSRVKKNGRDGGGQGNIPTRDETTRNIVIFFKVRTQKIISDGLFSSGISWTFRCCWLLWCLVEQDPVASQCRTDCSSVRKSYFLFFSGGECRIFLFFFTLAVARHVYLFTDSVALFPTAGK